MGPKIDQKTYQNLEAISRSIFGATHVRILGHLGRLGFSKIIGFPYVRLIFLKFVGRRFGRQLFRPTCAPRGRSVHQDGRRTRRVRGQGRTWRGLTETLDRDFGQRLWTETLDRDFGQTLHGDLARSSPVGRRIRHRALRDGVSGSLNMLAQTCLPLPLCLCLPVPLCLCLPCGAWCFFKKACFRGRAKHPRPWPPHGAPPPKVPKPLKILSFAPWSLLERPQSVLESPKTI